MDQDENDPPPVNEGLKAFVLLIAAITVDAIGMMSYAVPGLGESFDAIWAPVSSLFILKAFDSTMMAGVGFLEEILPFTDWIPSATLAWLKCYWSTLLPFLQQNRANRQQQRRRND